MGLISLAEKPDIVTNRIINIVYFSMSGVVAYFWLDFVVMMIEPEHRMKKAVPRIIRIIPSAVLIILSLVSIKTHWLFYIDDMGLYQRGSLYILQPILAYLLPIYATFYALRAVRKTKSNERKRQYRALASFYILPAIGGTLQILLKGTPMLNIGIAISGLWLYFMFQDNVTMIDPLTTMNNRRFFDHGLEESVHNFTPESGKHLYLIIMDVDYFKKINDGFGHAEGDKALITIADTLKEVCEQYNVTPARIGGDEFAVYFETSDILLADKLRESIIKTLSDKSSSYPFKLQLTMGCAEYQPNTDVQQLFVTADENLYKAKNARLSRIE